MARSHDFDIAGLVHELVVDPDADVRLHAWATDSRFGLTKETAGLVVADLLAELDDLHDRLWAEARRSILLVLQGMDASGKDGSIRKVLSGLNPQGCSVTSFKAPTTNELAHDYLWRAHAACPARGLLGVWNRSHYEDVVTARVLELIDDDERERRHHHLRDFERILTDEGTQLTKVFLHISKDEQRARLQERIDDPRKNWKFKPGDLETRQRWDRYQELYEQTIKATSTAWAPWYVVPADHKWVRDIAVASVLVHTLGHMDPEIPPRNPELRGVVVE